jgi:hypothetical protein
MLFEPAEPLAERVLQAMVGAELAAHIAHRLDLCRQPMAPGLGGFDRHDVVLSFMIATRCHSVRSLRSP